MDNLFSLMCFGALILFALFAFASMMRRGGGSAAPYSGAGNEFPRYDDPNVRSGGSFGGTGFGGTGFGTTPSASRGATLGGESPSHHDPNVRSGGSFGG
jgi:hypothetical protein